MTLILNEVWVLAQVVGRPGKNRTMVRIFDQKKSRFLFAEVATEQQTKPRRPKSRKGGRRG